MGVYIRVDEGRQPGANTVAYYPLSTDFTDQSGNSRDLTNTGATITTQGGVSCAYYNGASYSMYNSYSLANTARTMSIWVCRTTNSNGIPIMISNYSTSNYSGSLAVSYYSNYLLVADNYGAQAFAETTTNGNWYNVVAVQEGATVKGYINGVFKGESNSRPSQTPTGWTIGATHYSSPSNKFTGYASEAILEDKAWTATDVLNYYNQTKANYGL